ncbi:hypothetical protein MRB53_028395 [Persea americana]|uniref:Uncharacterized protein n=1 Tax=Persea americana TaxID=3435 RepID=A0ACC2KFR5_PERAE|nr:hypothetical protein MRB53_028395 [Persea americana]
MEGKIFQQTREDQCASDFRSINCNPKSFQKNCLAIQNKGQEKKISLRVSQAFSKIKGLQCLQRRKMVQSLRMRYKVKAVDVAGCDWIHVDRVPELVKAGADIVSVHCKQSSTIHLHRTLNQILSAEGTTQINGH